MLVEIPDRHVHQLGKDIAAHILRNLSSDPCHPDRDQKIQKQIGGKAHNGNPYGTAGGIRDKPQLSQKIVAKKDCHHNEIDGEKQEIDHCLGQRGRQKGIQRLHYSGKGDQYVKITVEVPKELTKVQKDKLKEFDAATDEGNYKKRKSFMDKVKDFFND